MADAQMAELQAGLGRTRARLPPECNRILYVRNLPYKVHTSIYTETHGKTQEEKQQQVSQ